MEIVRGKIAKAQKVVIYGPEGIGKSTLASKFPNPVFIDTEGSTYGMDVARLPKPSSWTYLLQEIDYVQKKTSICKTLVIDTVDWAEMMCVESVCAAHQKNGIEDFGYGNGYVYVKEEFGRFLNKLQELVDAGINVVITAHAQMRKFEQPDELGAYDRWELKLGKKTGSQTSPLVKEWADMVLFCNYKTMVINVDGKGAQKGKNKAQGNMRVMYTTHHACWDAKNRAGLPDECPMDYESIRAVIEHQPAAEKHKEPDQDFSVSKGVQASGQNKEQPAASPSAAEETGPEPPMVQETYASPIPPVLEQTQAGAVPEETPPDKSKATEEKAGEMVSKYLSDPARIPKELRDLMEADNVCEWNVQDAVAAKGYYPEGTLIQDMDPAFIQGVLVAAWPQVKALIDEIIKNHGIPFN